MFYLIFGLLYFLGSFLTSAVLHATTKFTNLEDDQIVISTFFWPFLFVVAAFAVPVAYIFSFSEKIGKHIARKLQ